MWKRYVIPIYITVDIFNCEAKMAFIWRPQSLSELTLYQISYEKDCSSKISKMQNSIEFGSDIFEYLKKVLTFRNSNGYSSVPMKNPGEFHREDYFACIE